MITKIKKKLSRYLYFEDSLTPKLLLGILLISATLRLQGLFWGIPIFDPMVQSYHPDEPKIINGAINFPKHILTNNDLRYPTFYHYFLGTLSIPARLVFKITGWPFKDFTTFVHVFGRLITILLGAGSVFLTFMLGKKLYSEKVGLLSALFITLSLYHVQNSSWATLDIPNSFFLVLTLYLAFNMFEKRSTSSYVLTGISLGLLTGTKYTGAIVLISILMLHFYQNPENKRKILSIIKTSFSKKLLLLILTALVVFLITTPGILLKPTVFISSLYELFNLDAGRRYRTVFDFWILVSSIKNYNTITDPVLTVIMILGLLISFKKRLNKAGPLLVIAVVFLIAFGSISGRHIIAILPVTSILGAQAIWGLYNKLKFVLNPVWTYLLTFFILFELAYNISGIVLRNNDTRTEAAYYLQKNIPKGSTLGAASIGNYPRWNWMFPKIDTEYYKVIDALNNPQFIILTSYDYIRMENALSSSKLKNYYWDSKYSHEWYKDHPPSEEVFRFYDDILHNKGIKHKYRLIKEFKKNIFVPIEFPSPQIRIYESLENL